MQARLKALIEKELHGTQAKADSKSAARDWFSPKDWFSWSPLDKQTGFFL